MTINSHRDTVFIYSISNTASDRLAVSTIQTDQSENTGEKLKTNRETKMSGFQFIHIETYARVPSAKHKKQSIRGIINEVERIPHACLHIKNPAAPTLVFGTNPSKVADQIYKLADECQDNLGRKIRKDAQLLLAGVVSYPKKATDTNYEDEHFQKWLKQTIEFLKVEYGSCLKSVILHSDDEEFPHCHYLVVPEPDSNGILNIRDIHPGMRARDTESDKGVGSGKVRRRLYKDAMRAFQDRYYSLVGISNGLSRLGPGRRRLTRKEWHDEQNRCEQIAFYKQEKTKIEKLSASIQLENKKKVQLLDSLKKEKKSLAKENFYKVKLGKNNWFGKSSKIDFLVTQNKKFNKKNTELLKKISSIETDYQAAKSKVKTLLAEVSLLKNKLSEFQMLLDEKRRQFELIKARYHKALEIIRNPLRLLKHSNSAESEVTYER